jgi:CHAT domain-containing protein
VLSACETGLGKVAGGEGVLGLQRAFQVAGARTTLTTLWQVDDEATRQLMERFYENYWRKRMPALVSLREAQLWMLHGSASGKNDTEVRGGVRVRRVEEPKAAGYASPYYWAAFVLSGDW